MSISARTSAPMNDQLNPQYSWRLRFLPALLWPLIILGLCTECYLRFDPVSSYLFEHCQVYEQVEDADQLHQQVLDAYRYGTDFAANSSFHINERAHFQDVAMRLSLLRWLSIAAAVGLIIMSIIHPLRFQWMRIGFYYFCAINLAIAIIGSRWLLFFRGMHPLIFSGDSWDFHPNDLILQLYPETFLAAYASIICISSLIVALMLFAWAHYRDPSKIWGEKYFTWHKKLGDASLVFALFTVPVYLCGQYMIHPWSFEWLLYWVLCFGICAACCSAVIFRNLANAVMLIAASAVLLHAFAFGVRDTTVHAQFMLKNLDVYQQALSSYHQQHNKYPEDLPTLLKAYPELPQKLLAPFHPLIYVNTGSHYYFYFNGPLKFEFSYRSDSNYWNHMRLP
ncbi:MAG: DUF1461 domain-containing protein [Planctomycetes bacterium]|nr:DUF1461 domain-containing protein [Planctomycetota bacterium]